MKWIVRIALAVIVIAVAMFGIRMCTSIQENAARERPPVTG